MDKDRDDVWNLVRQGLLGACRANGNNCVACQGLSYEAVSQSGGFGFDRYCRDCGKALAENKEYRLRVGGPAGNWLGDGLWDRFAAERHRVWLGLQPQPKEQRPVPVWEEPSV